MKSLFAATALILCATPALSALSGFHDSAEQVFILLNDATIDEALKSAPFEAVQNVGKREDGTLEWRIQAQDCVLTVRLQSVPPQAGMVGKTTYEIAHIGQCTPQ